MLKFDDATAKLIEIAYQGGDITRRRRMAFDALFLCEGDTVVDIGCGNGLLTDEIARAVGVTGRVIGIDPSDDMRALASKRCTKLSTVKIAEGFADALPLTAEAAATQPVGTGIALERLNFRYDITGDRVPWRPLRAFDDGARVFIEFPRGIEQGDLPPLFVIASEGKGQLVNYRIRRNYMIVDHLFAAADLRLGAGRQKQVRITRRDGQRRQGTRQTGEAKR